MYLGTIWELNIIDLGLRVHTFTLDFDTKGSVTYAKRIKQCEVKTGNSECLALRHYSLCYSVVWQNTYRASKHQKMWILI